MKYFVLIFILLIPFLTVNTTNAQGTSKVKGVVVSSTGNAPLEGINVSLENITLEEAVVTDENGEFSLPVPSGEVTLVFSFPDFYTQTVYLDNRSSLKIKMIPLYYDNPEKRVKGFEGINQFNQIIGNVINIDGNELRSVNKTSFDAMTTGAMQSVYTTTGSGLPSAGSTMIIRGASSFSGTGSPLVIVDGLIYRTEEFPVSIESGRLNLFADLAPDDIESVTVLKDAAATALYGSRGANGVIIINTHQGKLGATQFEVSATAGINSNAGKNVGLLNADQHRLLAYEQLYNAGWNVDQIATTYPNFLLNTPGSEEYERYNNNTNWTDEVYDNSAIFQNYYLRVSGGDEKAAYALSLGNRNEKGIVNGVDLNRFTARLNVDYRLSEKLTFGNYLSLAHTKVNQIEQGNSAFNPVLLTIAKTPVMAPFAQNTLGENTTEYDDVGELDQTNPVALLNTQEMINTRDQFNAMGYLEYNRNKNWYYRMNVGIVLENQKENYFVPGLGVVNIDGKGRISGRSSGNYFAFNNDWLASFTKKSDEHYYNVYAKANLQTTNMDMSYGIDINANTDYQKSLDGSDIDIISYNEHNVGNISGLLSANYIYRDKYLVTFNARADASSRFGSESPVGFFPGLLAGWRISNEDFLNDKDWMDELRINASYGLTGSSDNLPYFQTREFFTPGNYINYGGVVRVNLANRDLKWETTSELNLGADFRGFNNRVSFNVNYYNRLTKDIVVPMLASPVSGMSLIQINGGKVANNGIELAASTWLVDNESVKWRIGANLAFNKNKVKKLPGGKDIVYSYNGVQTILREGEAIGSFYGFETAKSVFTNASEISLTNDGYDPFQVGDVNFINQNGDNVIDANDQVVLGNGYADIFGGINTSVQYGGFEFSALCDFRIGNEVWNETRRFSESMSSLNNQSVSVLNRWREPGDISSIPRAALDDPAGNNRASDRWVEDGSFFRLRNVKLSYTFKNVFRGMVVYLAADNLVTFSKYLGAYPEVSSSDNILMKGVDFGSVPQTKSVMAGINLSL